MITKITLAGHFTGGQLHLESQLILPDWPDYVSIEGDGQYKKIGVSFQNPKNGYQNCEYEPTKETAAYVAIPRHSLGGFDTVTKQQPPKTCPFHGLQFGLENVTKNNGQFFGVYC